MLLIMLAFKFVVIANKSVVLLSLSAADQCDCKT